MNLKLDHDRKQSQFMNYFLTTLVYLLSQGNGCAWLLIK